MPMYLMLFRYTDQGMRTIKESPARIETFKKNVKALGGEVRDAFLCMGRYDTTAIINAPSDDVIARIALSLGSQGNVRSETMRLFSEEEMRKIVQGIQ